MTEIPATPRRSRTRLSAEQRRESILLAATEVFAEAGYRAGKMSQVAVRLGVSEPVVFQNFGSKAALFTAVLDRATDTVGEQIGGMAERRGSVSSLLAELLSPARVEHLHSRGSLGVLFADAAALTADPDVADVAKRAMRAVADLLVALLQRGQAEGEIRADLDPRAGAWWIISMMSARGLRAATTDGDKALETDLAVLTLHALTA